MNNKVKRKKDYKLIVFDFDGTLVDSVPSIYKTTNIMARKYCMKPISVEQIKDAIGVGLGIFLQKVFKKVLHLYGFDSIKKYYIKLYKKNCTYKNRTFPGVIHTLKILKKKGIKTVILSNKLSYFIKKSCKYVGIDKFFEEIIGRGELKKDKPDPYPINYISKKYKISKKKILFVGDSQYDAECASRAGVDFFYLKYGYGDKNKIKKFRPMYTKEKITDLLKVVNL